MIWKLLAKFAMLGIIVIENLDLIGRLITLARKKKCPYHSKGFILWWCPCAKNIPDFWKRLDECAWLIGLEASITSLGRMQIEQTKEKWGSTHIYFSNKTSIDFVNEGKCGQSSVWLAYHEGLLRMPEEMIPNQHDSLVKEARKLLKPYIGKTLPKSKKIFYGFKGKHFDAITSHQIPKYLWKAMERQRRLNPDLAHCITDCGINYDCNCSDNFWCSKYAKVNPLQKIWDKIIVAFLRFYGNHSRRWLALSGGFVVFGRSINPWLKLKRSLRKPF